MSISEVGLRPNVYLETSIIGHLASRLSRDLVTAGHQELTQEWWATRHRFDLYISELVVQEAVRGDAGEAGKRLAVLEGIPQLELNGACRHLARALLTQHAIPQHAVQDALHVAISAVHGMHYLLTWNCAHIANIERREAIEQSCRTSGYEPPAVCTPEQLMGVS